MAAYINRTMSMISGDSQFRTNDIRTENSPLQIFVKAKKKINDIFLEIDDYVDDTVRFIGCKYIFINSYHNFSHLIIHSQHYPYSVEK